MSSRVIRGGDRSTKIKVTASAASGATGDVMSGDHAAMDTEKQAFEQGYREGERIGKQMGERMMEAATKRYDRSVQELATLHRGLAQDMEKETVHLAMEIAKKIVQREVSADPDLVSALVAVVLKRVQGHSSITVRVSSYDRERVENCIRSVQSSIAVKEDPALERGDFMLDTSQTHIDARVSGQIETIGRALFELA